MCVIAVAEPIPRKFSLAKPLESEVITNRRNGWPEKNEGSKFDLILSKTTWHAGGEAVPML